ncbi:hypothetical protein EJ08DRAFT_637967 [Tothia fuscella]|uniref:PhoD-like phosphatase domain-containing protein n=1 Tax=Tothia fuscella TaxID=1048955 RepID=A0A9P4NLG7_9PEZI|nr:hypothetical protein EJ08DRAFT_637967 [Tothia fuscella]
MREPRLPSIQDDIRPRDETLRRDGPPRREYAGQYDQPPTRGLPISERDPPDAALLPPLQQTQQRPQQPQHNRFASVFHRKQPKPNDVPESPPVQAATSPSETVPEQRKHHLGGVFHHDDDGIRRYQPPQYRDYSKDIRVARLTLVEEVPASTDDTPWWEKGSKAPRRSSASATATDNAQYDGGYDTGGQTFFQPPLYLKCGPLLRFTGIRRDPRRHDRAPSGQSDRELWTGSIMIVTIDAKSASERPPRLRIFKQSVDLLPPPPAEVDVTSKHSLPPEYIDPIAGHVKMSRVGKTLFVRPVESLAVNRDLSRKEDDSGLFEEIKSATYGNAKGRSDNKTKARAERAGKYQEVSAYVLHQERGVTFWKFNIEIELGAKQARIAYRINQGPAIGFWVPGKGEMMNIMFHSCNGFSLSVDPNVFSGPDPLWRDVLNTHQTRPFHVMIGGGDQIYNDAATVQCKYFGEWAQIRNPATKHHYPFSVEMQYEMEEFYLNRYAMWFSQGMFGMANSQIPMVNIWDDHDIMDGFGSYPDRTMECPVMGGVGQVAFKYYMLYQHQSLPIEDERIEPSWLLGARPGPFIQEKSRSLFMFLGRNVALLGLDCRTERKRDEILSQDTWDSVFVRCRRELKKGETKHLIVLVGVPIAYPRLNFLENTLTSRLMDPIKALGRTGALGGFVNKFDGGVEILDDLDDHWTAKHHKDERNWFIQELQELAAEYSVRITILGGDVHLGAVGQFYSNKRLGIPKDQDHRYMPNVISSAIVNTPPSDMVADVLNKRNKVHHLDDETDEDMIPMFPEDVNSKARNNKHLLPRRNWCSIREYAPTDTPPHSPLTPETPEVPVSQRPPPVTRTMSLGGGTFAPKNLMRRLSKSGPRNSFSSQAPPTQSQEHQPQQPLDYFNHRDQEQQPSSASHTSDGAALSRPNPFLRRATFNPHANQPTHMVDLSRGLDIRLNVENAQGDPAGTTTEYRLLVPALDYRGAADEGLPEKPQGKMKKLMRMMTERGQASPTVSPATSPGSSEGMRTMTTDYGNGAGRRDSMSPPDGRVPPAIGNRGTAASAAGGQSTHPRGMPPVAYNINHSPPQARRSSFDGAGYDARSGSISGPGYRRDGYGAQPSNRSSLPPGIARGGGGALPPPGVVQRTAFPPTPGAVGQPQPQPQPRVRNVGFDAAANRRVSEDMSYRRRGGGSSDWDTLWRKNSS